MSERNRIVVDSGIVVWAVRYCLGRLSYAAGDGYRLVIRSASQLDDNAIACLRRDIREELDGGSWTDCGFQDIRAGWAMALTALEMEAAARLNEEQRVAG